LIQWIKDYKIFISVLFLVLFLAGYYVYSPIAPPTIPLNDRTSETFPVEAKNNKELELEKKAVQKIMVDLKGAVLAPGVYEANEGERVIELIERAGGLSENADRSKVNLAERVTDEMVLYIPAVGEVGEIVQGTPSFTQVDSKEAKVNINKADATQLETLPGIGPAKSAAIIEYRETSGPFKSIEDIKSISGIGDKTFEKLKDNISVD
jgi:competence protein ComEA